ncbi:MAG TPA: hypothetical protein PKZ36_00730 [Candidatus Paceibacterota bacterium]|nr:hypothetical protein [Candidatus Paceibacterota bacterium]HPT17923.1 hypothetical protein [Candidatus Paceibacterota bacterium]
MRSFKIFGMITIMIVISFMTFAQRQASLPNMDDSKEINSDAVSFNVDFVAFSLMNEFIQWNPLGIFLPLEETKKPPALLNEDGIVYTDTFLDRVLKENLIRNRHYWELEIVNKKIVSRKLFVNVNN